MDSAQIEKLRQQVQASELPVDISARMLQDLERVGVLMKSGSFTPEIDRQLAYISFVCTLPWGKMSQDILDLTRAKQILDKNHFGLEEVKERILEYLSVLILNQKKGTVAHPPILAF